MNSTPNRLSEKSFRRYEPFISEAIISYAPVLVSIDNLSPNTIEARLRDALVSLRVYQWEVSWPYTKKVEDLKVFRTEKGVYLGTQSPNKAVVVPSITELKSTGSPLPWTMSELVMICSLITQKKIQGEVVVPLIPSEDQKTLESMFDIAIISSDTTSTII
jgi:hypothetical protein